MLPNLSQLELRDEAPVGMDPSGAAGAGSSSSDAPDPLPSKLQKIGRRPATSRVVRQRSGTWGTQRSKIT